MLVTAPETPRITFGVPEMMVVGRLDGRPGMRGIVAPSELAKGSVFAVPVGVEIGDIPTSDAIRPPRFSSAEAGVDACWS